MTRKTIQFLKLAKKLDKELAKAADLFFRQRPFLADKTKEPEIRDLTDAEIEEKITNQYTIEAIIDEAKAL